MAKRTCSIEGCERPAKWGGWCSTHHARWERHGSTDLPPRPSDIERFMSKVDHDAATGCWLWTSHKAVCGYARFGVGGIQVYGHRWAYEQFIGPIPDGLQIDHLCRVRACVNPVHMEPVTAQENKRRGESPAALNAAKTHCLQGHPFAGDNLQIYSGGRVCRICHNARSMRGYYARSTRARRTFRQPRGV